MAKTFVWTAGVQGVAPEGLPSLVFEKGKRFSIPDDDNSFASLRGTNCIHNNMSSNP